MRFINRENELEYLKNSKLLSEKTLFTASIHGLRRVGKTRLVLEFLREKDIYFFVNKDKTSTSLLEEYCDELKKRKLLNELEVVDSWEIFFKVLFERYSGVVVFDEFQNFIYVERSIFGILQKYIDLNESKKNLFIIFTGSTIGLIKKLFSDGKEPLYGRIKKQIYLKPLTFFNSVKMCRELGIDDISEAIKLYAVFGGFPKYYVAIEDENLRGKKFEDIIEKFFFVENATLENEVGEILSLEFGKRSGVYYNIVTAVASGCTRISEIASFLRKKETVITRQVNELLHYFELISTEQEACGNKKRIFLNHPLINFWFRFFHKNLSSYKRRESWIIKKIKADINNYIGRRFEEVCREFLNEINNKRKLPFELEIIGRGWGKIQGKPKNENQYEIDIIALNNSTKEIMFCECKWQDKINAKEVLHKLKQKAGYVDWNKGKRKEYYTIFAKSFKEKIEEKGVLLVDLNDFKKVIKET